eukprot:TRINITY_DN11394_c0_g8_i1.p1 TRINITY_DN11394_c0_g8~~TRINITY_DN11394_c0_g8_i1.p1  ORF type:complete len:530 (-),score=45.67 TRINITY_DN11394_c0_g8_i1:148-1737(-)
MDDSSSDDETRPRRITLGRLLLMFGACLVIAGFVGLQNDSGSTEAGLRKHDSRAPLPASLDAFAPDADAAAAPACHDIRESDSNDCTKAMHWGRSKGWREHPEWFPGLTNASSVRDWQNWMYHNPPWGKCPVPCNYKKASLCSQSSDPAPKMWRPAAGSSSLDIKILCYNLYWWHLFDLNKGVHKGVKNSAAHLIKSTGPYDVLGFQECKNKTLLLQPLGLLDEYEAFEGWREICIAFRKAAWNLLDHGTRQVAVDQATEWYGTRGTQWLRLEHKQTGQRLFFANHHGPLSVNSGGQCGGASTARNMLQLVADKAQVGDAVIIVGDFNANAQSTTVQELWKSLVFLYNGPSFGGVDNIFGNMPMRSLVEAKEIGSGGSDHEAISATVRIGPTGSLHDMAARQPFMSQRTVEPWKAQHDAAAHSQCGILESDVEYTFSSHAGARTIPKIEPRACCSQCKSFHCKAWTYLSWDAHLQASRCTLYMTEPTSWRERLGAVSGLPPDQAGRKTSQLLQNAITEIPDNHDGGLSV